MGELVVHNGLKFTGTIPAGTGDEVLTVDPGSSTLGKIPAIDTSVFIPTVLPSANILVGNGSDVATAVPVTGDISITNAGVAAITSGVIVNADINASAAIAISKLAALTSSRALETNVSGIITPSAVTSTELGYLTGVTSAIQTQLNGKQATITGAATSITSSNLTNSRALVSDGSGKVSASGVTSTELSYVAGLSSAVQTQIDSKQAKIQFKDEGVNAGTLGGVTAVDFTGSGVTASESSGTLTINIPGTANGLPTGGTAGQYLRKSSGTNFDAAFAAIEPTELNGVTSVAADLNILSGAAAFGVTSTEFQYLNGLNSNIQTQLTALDTRSPSLASGYLWVGTVSGNATTLPPGSTGAILTMSGGVPGWSLNALQYAEVTISSAEILALFTTPKTIIAAPGAGKMIDVISLEVRYVYNSVQYATTTNLFISYNTGSADLHTTGIDFAPAYDVFTKVGLAQTGFNTATRVNTPLSALCKVANPTAGNGTIKVFVVYRIITV